MCDKTIDRASIPVATVMSWVTVVVIIVLVAISELRGLCQTKMGAGFSPAPIFIPSSRQT
jgi:hypothetical protein